MNNNKLEKINIEPEIENKELTSGIKLEDLNLLEKDLLQNLESNKKELESNEFQVLINRIFEHSLADGVKYSEELGLNRDEVLKALESPRFYLKHSKLVDNLISKIRTNDRYIDNKEESQEVVQSFKKQKDIFAGKEQISKDGLQETVLTKDNNKLSWPAKQSLAEIDSYYSNFINLQNVDLKKVENHRVFNNQKKKVIDYFTKTKEAMEGRYYAGEVEKIAFSALVYEKEEEISEIAKKTFNSVDSLKEQYNNDFGRYFNALKRNSAPVGDIIHKYFKKHGQDKELVQSLKQNSLIDKETLEKIKKEANLDDAVSEKMIKGAKYKPLDLVYNTQKSDLEKETFTSLKKSLELKTKSKEIILDDKLNEYVIKDVDLKKENIEKEKKLKTKLEIKKILNLDEIDGEIDGVSEFRVVVKNKENNKYILFNNNGERIGEEYDEVWSPVEINKEPYFKAYRDNKEFIVGPNGQKIG
ncbi:MAG: hypothetical protein ACLFNO_03695, partial [Parcubacteria group bacterium]